MCRGGRRGGLGRPEDGGGLRKSTVSIAILVCHFIMFCRICTACGAALGKDENEGTLKFQASCGAIAWIPKEIQGKQQHSREKALERPLPAALVCVANPVHCQFFDTKTKIRIQENVNCENRSKAEKSAGA